MTTRRRLLCYCQSLMGLGHLARTATLLESLSQLFDITLLLGGPAPSDVYLPDGITIIQLPAIEEKPPGTVQDSLDIRSPDVILHRRQRLAAHTATTTAPDVVLIELFPFGRKKFTPEILGLIKAARVAGRNPIVLSSVRDILVRGRSNQQAHDDRARDVLMKHFDGVLVHVDQQFARLAETFKPRHPVSIPVYHTGFVVRNRSTRKRRVGEAQQLVVSSGGGRYGEPLLRSALRAYQGMDNAPRLKLIAGPMLPAESFGQLLKASQNTDGVHVVRSVPDLPAELAVAVGSVSQAGYNTTMEVLVSGVPALLVPFVSPTDDEQSRRARRLADLGLIRVLEAPYDDAQLRWQMQEICRFRPARVNLDMDGAANSAKLIDDLVGSREPKRRISV